MKTVNQIVVALLIATSFVISTQAMEEEGTIVPGPCRVSDKYRIELKHFSYGGKITVYGRQSNEEIGNCFVQASPSKPDELFNSVLDIAISANSRAINVLVDGKCKTKYLKNYRLIGSHLLINDYGTKLIGEELPRESDASKFRIEDGKVKVGPEGFFSVNCYDQNAPPITDVHEVPLSPEKKLKGNREQLEKEGESGKSGTPKSPKPEQHKSLGTNYKVIGGLSLLAVTAGSFAVWHLWLKEKFEEKKREEEEEEREQEES